MTIRKNINILFTSVGRRSYLVKYFKESLNNHGEVHVSNSSALSPAFKVADKSIVSPLIYDEKYIPFLLNYCKENNITAVIPLFDIDLPVLSQNAYNFREIGVEVLVSDFPTINICNDKWETYKFLTANSINCPKTFLTLDEALKAIKNGNLNFPLIIKPRWGMGSIAIYQADNLDELSIFYNKVKNDIFNTYLKYESKANIDKSVLIQEKISGQEYGIDIINNINGDYINTIVKKKLAMRAGETDCAVTEYNASISKIGQKISSLLKHKYILDTDIFVKDDEIFILEMNNRFGGGYPFSHMAGVNLPEFIIEELEGLNPDKSLLDYKDNITCQKDINIISL